MSRRCPATIEYLVLAKSMHIVDLGNRSSGAGISQLMADGTAVAAVRGFNRFYTNVIGLLRGKYLDTAYSLTEARLPSNWRSGTPAR